MLAELERMSLSATGSSVSTPPRLVSRLDPGASEAIVTRLLMDSESVPVAEAMVAALLNVRREAGIPLVLRSLGAAAARPVSPCSRASMSSELDGVDVARDDRRGAAGE